MHLNAYQVDFIKRAAVTIVYGHNNLIIFPLNKIVFIGKIFCTRNISNP